MSSSSPAQQSNSIRLINEGSLRAILNDFRQTLLNDLRTEIKTNINCLETKLDTILDAIGVVPTNNNASTTTTAVVVENSFANSDVSSIKDEPNASGANSNTLLSMANNIDIIKPRKIADVSKVELDKVIPKGVLFDDYLCPAPKWTLENVDVSKQMNEIYATFGASPNLFLRQVVKEMYGDLLCFFKCTIQRFYDDVHRTTRKSLEAFDPTGFAILQAIISAYFAKHEGELIDSQTAQVLNKHEFITVAFKIIDSWGNRAYCKNGRGKPIVNCMLLNLIKKRYKLRQDFAEEEFDEIEQLYACVEIKQVKKRIEQPCTATKKYRPKKKRKIEESASSITVIQEAADDERVGCSTDKELQRNLDNILAGQQYAPHHIQKAEVQSSEYESDSDEMNCYFVHKQQKMDRNYP